MSTDADADDLLRKCTDSLKSSAAELRKRLLAFVSADIEEANALRDEANRAADDKKLLDCLGIVQLVTSLAKAVDPTAQGNPYLKTLADLQTSLSQDCSLQ